MALAEPNGDHLEDKAALGKVGGTAVDVTVADGDVAGGSEVDSCESRETPDT